MTVKRGDFWLDDSKGILDFLEKYFSKTDPNVSFGYSNNPMTNGDYSSLEAEYSTLDRFLNNKAQFASTSTKTDIKRDNEFSLTVYFAWYAYVPFVLARLMRALVGVNLAGEFKVDGAGERYMRVSENRSDGNYSMVFWRDRKKYYSNSYVRLIIQPVRLSAIQKSGVSKVSEFFTKIKFKIKFRAANGTSTSDEITFNDITPD